MLEFIINGIHLEYSAISLNFEQISSLFNENDGSAIFNFQFPNSPHNKKCFNFAGRINNNQSVLIQHDIQVIFNGIKLHDGICTVINADQDVIETSIGFSKSMFYNKIKGLYLKDIPYDAPFRYKESSYEQGDSILNYADLKYPEANFAIFTIYNTELFKDSNEYNAYYFKTRGFVNEFRRQPIISVFPVVKAWQNYNISLIHNGDLIEDVVVATSDIIVLCDQDISSENGVYVVGAVAGDTHRHNSYPNPPQFKTVPGIAISPYPYLCYVLDKIFEFAGYTIQKSIFHADEELSTLCLITQNLVANSILQDLSQYYIVDIKNHVPDVLIADFLKELENLLNCSFNFNNNRKTVDIVSKQNCLNSAAILLKNMPLYSNLISYKKPKNYNLHIEIENDEKFKRTVQQDFLIKNTDPIPSVATKSDLPDVATTFANTIYFVEDEGLYYMLKFFMYDNGSSEYPDWAWVTYPYFDYLVNFGESETEQLITKCGICIQENVSYSWNGDHRGMPVVEIKGNWARNPFYGIDKYQEQPIKLAFYRGLQTSDEGYLFACGSSFNYIFHGNIIGDAKYSLQWDGEFGLYENFWRIWIDFLHRTKLINIKILLKSLEISNIDFIEKYKIGDNNYFIDKNRLTITEKSKDDVMAEIDAYLV